MEKHLLQKTYYVLVQYTIFFFSDTRRWEWFTSENLLPLNQQLVSSYKPAIDVSTVGLYVARQWDERSKTEEALLSGTGVNGLVFSSFRFDNPKTVARGKLEYTV